MQFKLRPFNLNDLDSLVENADNVEIAKFMTDAFPNPYTIEKGKAFIEMANKDNPVHIFAIAVNEKAVGGIGIHPQTDIHKKNAELGYWLGEKYWGNGIMTRAIKQMIEFGFKTYDITRIYARPFGSNIASQRILEKTGFILEARIKNNLYKNGQFDDELIYAVRKESC
jgi:RimJ/RimL family protein N-acetyltransferase